MTLPDVQLLSPPPCCGRSLGVTSKASFCDVRSGGKAGVLVTRVLKARCNSSSSKPGLGVAGLIPATAAMQVWPMAFLNLSTFSVFLPLLQFSSKALIHELATL